MSEEDELKYFKSKLLTNFKSSGLLDNLKVFLKFS